MTNIIKTSEFNEFVYPKFNPLGLVDDLYSDDKYRGHILFNNRRKLYRFNNDIDRVLQYISYNIKGSKTDMMKAMTIELKYGIIPELSRRVYYDSIKLMLELSLISKVYKNKDADRRYYVNPNIICKLTKSQKNEFSAVHYEYFKHLT